MGHWRQGEPGDVHNRAFLRHARNSDAEGARRCLERGVDPDIEGGAALAAFVNAGNYNGVKALFDFDVNPHINNGAEYLTAVQRNFKDIVGLMLERAPSLDIYGEKALMIASLCAWEAPNVLTVMLEKASFTQEALDNALAHAAHLNSGKNIRALCAGGAKLSASKIDDIRVGLRNNYRGGPHWSGATIKTLGAFPQNVPMLYVASHLFERRDVQQLTPVARVRAFDALLALENTLRQAPDYMRPAVAALVKHHVQQQLDAGRITFSQIPGKKAEALRGLFNWSSSSPPMRKAIIEAAVCPGENPTRKFVGADTADPFALDY